jgi:hypothetical protein
MGRYLENFGKSQKCRAKKLISPEPMLLHTLNAHQLSCNTFFLQDYFFVGESWKKYFFDPTNKPRDMFVTPLGLVIRRAKRA